MKLANMASRAIFAIAKRRWWAGGGYVVLQGPGWPYKIAWFRELTHAECFVRLFKVYLSDEDRKDLA